MINPSHFVQSAASYGDSPSGIFDLYYLSPAGYRTHHSLCLLGVAHTHDTTVSASSSSLHPADLQPLSLPHRSKAPHLLHHAPPPPPRHDPMAPSKLPPVPINPPVTPTPLPISTASPSRPLPLRIPNKITISLSSPNLLQPTRTRRRSQGSASVNDISRLSPSRPRCRRSPARRRWGSRSGGEGEGG